MLFQLAAPAGSDGAVKPGRRIDPSKPFAHWSRTRRSASRPVRYASDCARIDALGWTAAMCHQLPMAEADCIRERDHSSSGRPWPWAYQV